MHAAHALVARKGFAGAKVAAVAEACGVSAGSLYSYFGSRDELLAQVFRRAAGRELAAVRGAVDAAPADPEARLKAFADTFTRRALRGRRLAWSLLFEPVSPVVERERLVYRREYAQLCEGVIRDGVAAGLFARQNAAIAASAAIGAISEALVGRLSPEVARKAEVPDEQLVAEIRDFCLRALGRTPS
ncbi:MULTISPECIES: TetR/AcrR family transcriptional regulator [Streptomyces]|uniref:DNA-binding transcriptional regulator, AcrR family n=1 Tax=Streptomyces misionensis TaxID=67331 RepID=A0A1H5G872_9ACTN|nr:MULTISPECIES: TetR/AcrR family transcriptional regulator [Streptomyces]SEE11701.1 DNA-binding transcriptional regulator, AcrR family [Streptomyces misionensis]SFY48408.1 HTH-type transcriptional regulator BetI [Streptomyces sp. F-1]